MFEITDPSINRLILLYLVERMEEGQESFDDLLLNSGVDPHLLDMLRRRPARDFIRAAKLEQFPITVSFDSAAVMATFGRLDDITHDSELCEYFVLHGASPDMLSKLFKLSVEQIRQQRILLLPGGTQSGRPKYPPLALRERIHNDWDRLAKEKPSAPLRERLYELHRLHTAWSIHSLWCTLHEFEEAPSVRRSAR